MELVTSGSPSLDTLNVLTVVQCIFFFFQCYHIHVDLHSFPTRRSSDLSGVNPVPAFGFFSLFAQGFGAAPIRALADVPSIDRKSTRLNSSHTVISYAVFCLKKKTVKSKSCSSSAPAHLRKLRRTPFVMS